ncbi:MAG: hypothetical protein JXA17_03145 [Dehalococcoidales bacterium]|nr:hypothetical protein [Dehalococcoidales bacterium]
MKKFSHAWLAFMAIKSLDDKKQDLSDADRKHAESLILWFMNHKDKVVQGAWFPDELIKDMADKHVLKFCPADKAPPNTVSIPPEKRKVLPEEYLIFKHGRASPVFEQAFNVTDPKDNLPDRCESLAEAVVDQLKVQEYEEKGSPVSPTDNQVALWLFMLSHYVADAHVPVHCDSRQFSSGKNIHGKLEKAWDDEIKKYYRLNSQKTRFLYDTDGYPKTAGDLATDKAYQKSFLKAVADELESRKYSHSFGKGNNNVWDFANAICHNSYLISYRFFPSGYGPDNVNAQNWKTLAPDFSLQQVSTAVLADAIDSISRVWFRVWRRYEMWEKKKKQI